MSAIDKAMFSFSASESNFVFCTPISFIGRLPHTVTSSIWWMRRVIPCADNTDGQTSSSEKSMYFV
ncbi:MULTISPECIES: hypothetical protein [Bacteroidales]|uniref:hypothetical protein n=1 Tax=Bacteroidales TaxID=171549 RepID=UPI001CCD708B|nr:MULTISPECIES: hypothetical protein [Bacteroidales]MCS2442522.1 hypothetical protein [Bacteroides uniformis]MDB8980467.1 hypothetical protein [Parabacteroides merdae]MDB9082407.1 hypothetical protein [Parabacteroides merdae]MDC1761852.1 hypothetical protein [Bacteroides uniformis]MDC1955977.1 hypothetical protein [Bacteroides uniformis]